jgi:hypothetical protein
MSNPCDFVTRYAQPSRWYVRLLAYKECAVAGQSRYVVTRDPDLLTFRMYQDVQMVSPGMFSQLLLRGTVKPGDDV